MSRRSSPDLFDHWTGTEAPAGFADAVVETFAAADPEPRRHWRLVAAFAVGAVATLLLWGALKGLPSRPNDVPAPLLPGVRTVLADGVVVRSERGARLVVAGDREPLELVQEAGSIEFDIRRTDPALVSAGPVSLWATNARFRVELKPMKREILSGAAGAAMALVATAVVYEGTVRGESGGHTQEARAGETLTADPSGSAKVESSSSGVDLATGLASREQLVVRERMQARRIQSLENRLANMEVELANARRRAEGAPILEPGQPPDDKRFDFSQEELEWMARNCQVRYQVPFPAMTVDPSRGVAAISNAVDLSGDEKAALARVFEQGQPDLLEQMRVIYIEVTGDEAGAQSLSPRNLQHEVFAKVPPEDMDEAMRRISAERAGYEDPPANLEERSAGERMIRLIYQWADRFEADLANQVGPERARQLRKDGLGYASRRQRSDNCRPPGR